MSANPVNWFEIYVEDMQRARRFYETVLGVKLEKLDMQGAEGMEDGMELMAFPMTEEAPGAAGALCRMPGFGPGGNSTLIYFSSEDCSIEAARVAAAGGRVQQEKQSIGDYGFIALAVDTEGNIFGIHSRK